MNGFIYFNLKKTNMTYNDLPLFEAYIDSTDETGMFVVSLVDAPAVEKNFVAFKDNKKVFSYSIANEEQQKVFGLVMEANKPIYRVDESGFEYYITYNRKTIEMMAEKYFKLGFQNNVDTMHNFDLEDGIILTQMFIKDSEKGVNPIGFEDVNDGSLFAEYHIENADIWNAIKEGTFKGFSLAGQFYIKEAQEVKEAYNKKDNNKLQMKINKVKAMLRKLLAQFGEVATDKGTILWDGEEDLKEGDSVYSLDESGNQIALEDGEYITEDKKVITIQEGKVLSIVDTAAEVDGEEKPIEGAEEGNEGSEGAEETGTTETVETAIAELRKEVDELYKLVDSILEKIGESRKEADERFSKLEKQSASKSATEAFEDLKEDKTESTRMKKRGYKF